MPKKGTPDYEDFREYKATEFREKSTAGRDIGEIPLCANPARRAAAEESLLEFCQYFPESFYLEFSPDHLRVIEKIEHAVKHGGLFAMAMPRGSGKSTLCVIGCIWAVACGHHDFVLLVGASEPAATDMLDSIKTQLETNDLLLADFPEICYPIRKLEGIKQRRLLHNGNPVRMTFVEKEIILPDIPMRPVAPIEAKRGRGRPRKGEEHNSKKITHVVNKSASACIGVAGITGRIRGRRITRPDGKDVRPSFVLVDDPQTDESARSPSQCTDRLRIMNGAILGVSGPGKKIAGVVPCTVITANDMADQLLDRKANPQWHGEKTKLVYTWPDDMTAEDVEGEPRRIRHWDEYAAIRAEDMRRDLGPERCNAYVMERFEEMHKGSVVAWPERFNADEVSALQNAINIRLDRGIPAFDAEYNNNPHRDEASDQPQITVELVHSKLNNLPLGSVPGPAGHLTGFIDVMHKALYWMVCAWEPDFSGYILDYGTFPEQGQAYFTLSNLKRTMAIKWPNLGTEGLITAGIHALSRILITREFPRLNGGIAKLNRLLVDSSDGNLEKVIHKAIQTSDFSGLLLPSKGIGINASLAPMSNWKTAPGEYRTNTVHSKEPGNDLKTLKIDSNFWKTFVANRLFVGMGDKSCLSLFGDSTERHKMLADHLTSELRDIDEKRERKVEIWTKKSNRDNHWFDCLVGCAAGAGFDGACVLDEYKPTPQSKASGRSWKEMRAQKTGAR